MNLCGTTEAAPPIPLVHLFVHDCPSSFPLNNNKPLDVQLENSLNRPPLLQFSLCKDSESRMTSPLRVDLGPFTKLFKSIQGFPPECQPHGCLIFLSKLFETRACTRDGTKCGLCPGPQLIRLVTNTQLGHQPWGISYPSRMTMKAGGCPFRKMRGRQLNREKCGGGSFALPC